MTENQLHTLIEQRGVPEKNAQLILVETHVSWVLLSEQYAYKIKKPVRFSFLDFSTLEKRKFFCERELVLNRRLTSGVYLDVLPICQKDNSISIKTQSEGKVIDYAVRMKRLDSERQMHKLLENNQVNIKQIEQLAEQLAAFHARAAVIESPFHVKGLDEKFADLLKIKDFLTKEWERGAAEALEAAVMQSSGFLKQHASRFVERSKLGFVVDGHGDLHSANIFLLDQPVIFDCIEFNDQFRQVDMLDEIAFLCLDLNFYHKPDLEKHFLERYLAKMPCVKQESDWLIFHYYKCYRANVRLKVTVLRAMQDEAAADYNEEMANARIYFDLLKKYLDSLR